MKETKNLIYLRTYCREHNWPRLPQWNHWITNRKPIALACVKMIEGRYMIDLEKFQEFINNASIE